MSSPFLVVAILGALMVLAVPGEEMSREAVYGNQDMFAESTIIRQGYAYPGVGGQGIGYSSGSGFSGGASVPYFPGKVEPFGPAIQQGAYYYPAARGVKYGYEAVGPVGFGYGPAIPKYGGAYLTEEKYPLPYVAPKVGGFGYAAGPGIGYAAPGIGGAYGGGAGGFIGGGAGAGYGGGEYVNKNIYGGGEKELKDIRFEKAEGKKGEEFHESKEGFNDGKAAVKNVKADSGFYSDEEGGKKLNEDAKQYYGGHHYNQEGKNGEEKKIKQGHRKGHVIKGFKTSHHKDESGKTEEYYDEEHDEGENANFNEQGGSFGEKEASSYKGAHEDGGYKANQGKKEGHYDNVHLIDNNNGDSGQYGSKKYGGSSSVYGVNNGADEQSLLGHQESKKFIKHQPEHVPFFTSRFYKK